MNQHSDRKIKGLALCVHRHSDRQNKGAAVCEPQTTQAGSKERKHDDLDDQPKGGRENVQQMSLH